MTIRRRILAVPVAAAAAALVGGLILASTGCERPALGQSQKAETESPEHEGEGGIVGSWSVTDPNNPNFHALSTFFDDGLFVASPASAMTSGGHGVWIKTGPHEFVVTFLLFGRGPAGNPVTLIKRQEQTTLSNDGNTFHGNGEAEVCDLNGQNCVAHMDMRDGIRITTKSFP
jgi:hypothetical protein